MADFNKLSETVVSELGEVFSRMDDTSVRPLLEAIKKAPRIFLFGLGREGLSTKSFAMRLMHLGKESHWMFDDTTPAIQKGDLVIISCGCGNNAIMGHVMEEARKHGAILAHMSAMPSNPFADMADIVTMMPATSFHSSGDHLVPTKQLMGNQFEQGLMLLFDIIVMMLQEELGITAEEMETRHRNVE
ncbi:SIS domain-containing protein [Lacrimispora sp. NSJ-141]|uniref:SIS domain-containing protein n=1 Tax=Lientehia hominis TaxID=2897778 RepID=A0AAP2W9G9_9FIRM|nr:SIS domain-containing protein [Lientehia hominis]MCD2493360.1 SIS domain-containing protein [Lientehia hominis]